MLHIELISGVSEPTDPGDNATLVALDVNRIGMA